MLHADVCTDIKTVTKKYGFENSWRLGSCISFNRGLKFSSNKEYTRECCQAPGSYELKCKCSFGDGWHGGYVEIQGKKYCKSFSGGKVKKEQVTITGTSLRFYSSAIYHKWLNKAKTYVENQSNFKSTANQICNLLGVFNTIL